MTSRYEPEEKTEVKHKLPPHGDIAVLKCRLVVKTSVERLPLPGNRKARTLVTCHVLSPGISLGLKKKKTNERKHVLTVKTLVSESSSYFRANEKRERLCKKSCDF